MPVPKRIPQMTPKMLRALAMIPTMRTLTKSEASAASAMDVLLPEIWRRARQSGAQGRALQPWQRTPTATPAMRFVKPTQHPLKK